MKKIIVVFIALHVILKIDAQTPTTSSIQSVLNTIIDSTAKSVLANPTTFRYQIIYTQINRDKMGVPHFTNYTYHADASAYFNPASMVKMPLAFLSLEKLNELKKPGVNKYTTIQFDSNYTRQVAMYKDASAPKEQPTLAHLIKRAFLISENDPYNRMYQFVGQGEINRKLHQKGYGSVRITRQFMGYTEDQNRHTNGIRFLDDKGNTIYTEAPKYNTDSFHFGPPVLIGDAHWNSKDEVVNAPFDFTKHNNLSLEDMRKMLQSVVFPTSVEKQNRFNLKEEDRLFLLQYLSQYPSETNYPKYDTSIFYDSYVKFFFQDSTHSMPKNIRVFNKVGWAYGFLTDVSYVLDTANNIDYMLAATVYVNSDGVVNDSKYDEATVGFPFLKQIGAAFYNYELKRKRNHQPKLKNQVLHYEKRDPKDTRHSIKEVDN
ncbi:MAG: serine hydrolase [Sediminibacterium sp.]